LQLEPLSLPLGLALRLLGRRHTPRQDRRCPRRVHPVDLLRRVAEGRQLRPHRPSDHKLDGCHRPARGFQRPALSIRHPRDRQDSAVAVAVAVAGDVVVVAAAATTTTGAIAIIFVARWYAHELRHGSGCLAAL